MAARKVSYLLVGGGLASANCARWLREEGADGEVLLVGREPDPPYNRPDCSKGYLRGEESREEPLFRPGDWWAEQEIELLLRTSVTGIDLQTRTARLSTKDEVEFDKLLVATGANGLVSNDPRLFARIQASLWTLRPLWGPKSPKRGSDRSRRGGRGCVAAALLRLHRRFQLL